MQQTNAGREQGRSHLYSADSRTEENQPVSEDFMNAKQEIIRLQTLLREKTNMIAALNETITDFNSIATNVYRVSLKHLYMRLEYILLNDARRLDNTGRANLRKMQATIQKVKLMNDDFIYLSEIYALNKAPQPVDLNRILRIVKNNFEAKAVETGLQISSEELPVISGSVLLLITLFQHLVEHSLRIKEDARPPQIVVAQRIADAGEAGNPLSRAGYKISFSMNGKHIDEAEKKTLFNIIESMQASSKGRYGTVHLPVVKKIMELHNGGISAESNGDGMIYHCFFPVEVSRGEEKGLRVVD